MEVTNALAYYDTVTITGVKSFRIHAPKLNTSYKIKSCTFLGSLGNVVTMYVTAMTKEPRNWKQFTTLLTISIKI
jgi:hypothetical protein